MTISTPCRWLALIAVVFSMAVLAGSTHVQQDDDLRRENQQLRDELEKAQQRIEELEAEVERMQQAIDRLRNRPGDDLPDSDEEVTIDESQPDASPRALLAALTEHYNEFVGDMDPGQAGERSRELYLRNLNRWRSRVSREFRSQVQWHVRVINASESRRGYDLKVAAVDPETHVQLGEPFAVTIGRSTARRYEQFRSRNDVDVLVARATLIPEITINPSRQTAGPFDNPPLIGPFAEFGFKLEIRSLLPVGEDE